MLSSLNTCQYAAKSEELFTYFENMKQNTIFKFDHLVIGSGLAGMATALNLADKGGDVAIVTKAGADESATRYAQGGVACVVHASDSFEEHIADTLEAGRRMCNEDVVRAIMEN